MYKTSHFRYPSQSIDSPKNNHHFTHTKSAIDSLLKNDIHILRSNKNKTTQIDQFQIAKNKQVVLNYIQNNYQEYKIEDPLPHLARPKHQRYYTSFENNTIQKKSEIYSSVQPSTNKKIIKLQANKFNSKVKTQPKEDESPERQFHMKTEGTEATVQKMHKPLIKLVRPKNNKLDFEQTIVPSRNGKKEHFLTNQFLIEEEQKSELEGVQFLESRYISIPSHKNINNSKKKQKRSEEINIVSQTFRYCIGCQKAILEANINYHQTICRQFQIFMKLPLEQIITLLDAKIIKFEQSILTLSKNQSHITQLCQNIVSESRRTRQKSLAESSFLQAHQNITMNSKQSIFLQETLSKLNWFVRMRDHIWKRIK